MIGGQHKWTASTTSNVNKVLIDRPLAITRPILKRDTAPAALATISGITPSAIAAVVTSIGCCRETCA